MRKLIVAFCGLALIGCGGDDDGDDAVTLMDSGSGPDTGADIDSGTPPTCDNAADGTCPPGCADDPDCDTPDVDSGPPPPMDSGRPPPPPFDAGPPPESRDVSCADPAPDGADLPAAPPTYSGGACPVLMPGTNTIMSGGIERQFVLVVPDDYDADNETLPLMFAWHHLGGSASSILNHGRVQESSNELRFIAAVPEKAGDVSLNLVVQEIDLVWPYLDVVQGQVEREATFFDDMFACIQEQYQVNLNCVSTMGISAGALWSSQLMQLRSQYLASAMIISGGVGPAPIGASLGFPVADVLPWTGADHNMPTMVLYGGPDDGCAVDFQVSSENLEDRLNRESHFVMECVHNCGHAAPPVEDPTIGLGVLYRFALDHPYWLEDRESPYYVRGLPEGTPEWCNLGPFSATARDGSCLDEMGEMVVSCPVGALK